MIVIGKHVVRMMALLLAAVSMTAHAQFWNKKQNTLLPGEEAFSATAEVVGDQLLVHWSVADEYYMYRDQFGVTSSTAGVELGDLVFPEGVIEDDPEFGEVVVYFYNVTLSAPIQALPATSGSLQLTLKGQGCNKPVGVCYPPQTRALTVAYDANQAVAGNALGQPASEGSSEKTFWSYVLAAFGAGLLLSFTPCVLPMVPILLGIIAGQKNPSKLESGWLAICYVGGTVLIYAIAGWIAGLSGAQLQAHFQNPWVIGFICLLLIALASSLFGLFRIELPSALQTRLSAQSVNTRSASISSFTLGAISSLVVGACVSPILILTLGAAISKADPVLGLGIMSAMALGMGMLLIFVGFGAGWILPRAGAWMKQIQIIFGFMVLGVAIYIAGFIDRVPVLYLWSGLLLWSGYYVFRVSQEIVAPLGHTLLRALSAAIILWGGMAMIGAASGGSDVLRPLNTITSLAGDRGGRLDKLPFNTVTKLADAKRLLEQAKSEKKPVLVDFYADWCLDCKRMARTTFTEPAVHMAVADWQLIEVDVTKTNQDSEALKQFFDVFGPPATLFIRNNGQERADLRQYGYLNKDDFLALIERAGNQGTSD